MFRGFDKLYRQGRVWHMLWHFFSCLNLMPWMIVNCLSNDIRLENALVEYEALGGGYARDLPALSENEIFINCLKSVHSGDYFADYNAIIMMKNSGYRDGSVRIFKKKHPKALILCETLGPFGNSKLVMSSLFTSDEELKKYRPKCMVIPKKYSRKLAKKVADTLEGDCFVIKPINSSKGNGVIMVKRRDLFQTLRKILKDPSRLPDIKDPTYGYWLRDRNKHFLIEEYAPSKLITVETKKYDATMRVIYVLFCDKGKIGITFLGAYWKLPAKSISESGLLTEKYKSCIKPDKIGAAIVDGKDYEKVTGILRKVLPMAYIKMLQEREIYFKKW
jgi:hypothetical protein